MLLQNIFYGDNLKIVYVIVISAAIFTIYRQSNTLVSLQKSMGKAPPGLKTRVYNAIDLESLHDALLYTLTNVSLRQDRNPNTNAFDLQSTFLLNVKSENARVLTDARSNKISGLVMFIKRDLRLSDIGQSDKVPAGLTVFEITRKNTTASESEIGLRYLSSSMGGVIISGTSETSEQQQTFVLIDGQDVLAIAFKSIAPF